MKKNLLVLFVAAMATLALAPTADAKNSLHKCTSLSNPTAFADPTVEKILAWDFNASNPGTEYNSNWCAGLVSSFLSAGNGLEESVTAKSYTFRRKAGVSTTTFAEAKANNTYFQFSLQPMYAKKVSLANLSARLKRSTTGSPNFQWTYSIDGGALFTNIGSVITISDDATGELTTPLDLTGVTELQNLAPQNRVIIRLYHWGASDDAGTTALGNGTTTESITLNGTLEDMQDDAVMLRWRSNSFTGQNASFPSYSNAPAVSSSTITRGDGTVVTSLNRGFPTKPNSTLGYAAVPDRASAIANNVYTELDFTVQPNYKLSLTKIHATFRRSAKSGAGDGASTHQYRASVDDGATFFDVSGELQSLNFGTAGVEQAPVDLSVIPALQNLVAGAKVIFRLYSWDYTSTAGTFAYGQSDAPSDDVFAIFGTATDASLPVKLTKFEAKKAGRQVNLNWTTASEQNNSHFDVLKSTDAKDWTLLSTITGAGTKSGFSNYAYTDVNPAKGDNYYQLKQVDFDAKYDLSPVRVVNVAFSNSTLSAYKSAPSNVTAVISLQKPTLGIISLYNISGKLIYQVKSELNAGTSKLPLLVDLSAGIYIIKLISSTEKLSAKFIVY